MTQKSQVNSSKKTERGNSRSRSWCFTHNNYTKKDIQTYLTQLSQAFLYIFQEEIGEDGTPHLQGVIKWKHQRYFNAMRKLQPKAHWTMTRDLQYSINYCNKKDTRNGEQFKKNVSKYLNSLPDDKEFNKNVTEHKNKMIISMKKLTYFQLTGLHD